MDNVPATNEGLGGGLPETKEQKKELQPSHVQEEMEKLIPLAGTIELTEAQKEILFAPVKDEDIEIRPDGLIYLPWMEYVTRLQKAFGISWAILPKDMPLFKGNHIYWPLYLMIQGKWAGFAIGEQEYHPTNANMTYGDAVEGAKSNALMRLCKGLGISLELWKPSFIRAWKEKYAESFPAVYPDGKPKLDAKGNQKTEWRKKNGKQESFEQLHTKSEKIFVELHDRMTKIVNGIELQNWWKKHSEEIKSLLPEHFKQIEDFKNKLKEKFNG